MKIAMFTNVYLPLLGGVSFSVDRFSREYQKRGHEVLIVAPEMTGQPENEETVVRIHAIQNFTGTDFSVALPPGPKLTHRLGEFKPEIIHSHQPFLLGNTAVRVASQRNLPLIYTHHTMYEYYTHYAPIDAKVLRNYVVHLTTRYEQDSNMVIAPSQSVADIIRNRGVTTPVEVIPTGVDMETFSSVDGTRAREELDIGEQEFIMGFVGRLQEEKNLAFLVRTVMQVLRENDRARFLVVGTGEMEQPMREMFENEGLIKRAIFAGPRTGKELADMYAAMDVFVFASKSETQGMVLVEALAAGTPVVTLVVPGAKDVVRDGENGKLVQNENEREFARAVQWFLDLPDEKTEDMSNRAREDAKQLSLDRCVDKVLDAYRRILDSGATVAGQFDNLHWNELLRSIRSEWDIWSRRAGSLRDALRENNDPTKS
jgi:glycosyltransferase involved in cell wall biosynthesis